MPFLSPLEGNIYLRLDSQGHSNVQHQGFLVSDFWSFFYENENIYTLHKKGLLSVFIFNLKWTSYSANLCLIHRDVFSLCRLCKVKSSGTFTWAKLTQCCGPMSLCFIPLFHRRCLSWSVDTGCGIADILSWRNAACITGTTLTIKKPRYDRGGRGQDWAQSPIISYSAVLFLSFRVQRAPSLCPAPSVSVSDPSRGTRVLDLSPLSWSTTFLISSRMRARKP